MEVVEQHMQLPLSEDRLRQPLSKLPRLLALDRYG